MTGEPRDEGFDDWLDALAAGDGYYLACENDHGWLPPRRVCPRCGSTHLAERPLPATGAVETATTVHVSGPDFTDDTPYVTAIVDFGPVRVTGVLRGVDPEGDHVGTTVDASVAAHGDDRRIVVFRPR